MLQCSVRRNQKKWVSFMSVVSNRHMSETFGIDYCPEFLSRIILYIKDSFDPNTQSSKDGLDRLVQSMLRNYTPEFSNSVYLVLEAHGWENNSFFSNEFNSFSAPDFNTVIKVLYYSQIWKMIRLKERRNTFLYSTRGMYLDDDYLSLAFVPSILHSLVTNNNVVVADNVVGGGSVLPRKLVPKSFSFSGVCLLADISGFTKMSASFCDKGMTGLDDLHTNTSDFLGQYVQIVYAHGGDVIAFAGDALICVFRDISIYTKDMQSNHSLLELCCMSALNCSLKLVNLKTDLLTSHVGISCGDMQFSSLGGFKYEWVFVLTGRVMSDLSSCIDDTKSCQVGISPDVFNHLSRMIDSNQLNATSVPSSGNYVIDNVTDGCLTTHIRLRNRFKVMGNKASDVKILRRFVPRPILHSIVCGTLDTISELRSVTTVFLKLDSYCPISNADPLSLQSFVELAQKVLHAAGGFLRQFLIDDKGCVLIAMWGVPSYTFKNNNDRAISFALAIHKGVQELHHRCSIGVATGNVFCGNVGSLQRRDYVGIGAKVNLAARLMSKAKGSIYVDEETASSVACLLPNMMKSEDMQLKGYDEMICAYVLTGLESFVLSTEGTSTSTYVQAGVTRQIMSLLNKVKTSGDQLSGSGGTGGTGGTGGSSGNLLGSSGGGAKWTGKEPIAKGQFEGGLAEATYHSLYTFLPSPDTVDTTSNIVLTGDLTKAVAVSPGKNAVTARKMVAGMAIGKLSSHSKSSAIATKKTSHCMVVESQSGGGKSAVALMFGSYSVKRSLQSYVIHLTSVDLTIDHCVFRKLFFQLVKLDEKWSIDKQNAVLISLLRQCEWPNRPHIDDRVEGLATVLGLRDQSGQLDDDEDANVDNENMNIVESTVKIKKEEEATNVEVNAICIRDVIYFLLGQQRCSIIIEHGHFADALSWSDLHYVMEREHLAVGVLVTARVGSSKDDYCKETSKFESHKDRRDLLTDFQVSIRSNLCYSISSTNSSGVFSSKNNSPNASFNGGPNSNSNPNAAKLIMKNRQTEQPREIMFQQSSENVSTRNNESSRTKLEDSPSMRIGLSLRESRRRSLEHFFDKEEPVMREDTIAYDRAHYTDSYNLLISHPRTIKLELPNLEVEEIGHLCSVDLHWHENDMLPGLLKEMHLITHGNAYWCKEVAHFISVRGQESFIKDPKTALATVVMTVVNEKLSMEQQIIIKVASVIGYVFSFDSLKFALPTRLHETMMESVIHLGDHNFLSRLSDQPLVYSFPNSLIKDILNDMSPPSDRSNTHVVIAQQLEGVNSHNLEPFYEMLCYHYSQALDQVEKSLFYKIKSAEKVLVLGFMDDFYGYMESALPLTDDIATLFQMMQLLDTASSSSTFSNAPSGSQIRSQVVSRRPSLDLDQPISASPINTPRTRAFQADIPNKIRHLKVLVAKKFEIASVNKFEMMTMENLSVNKQ